jgi:hypothetical protein
LNWSTTSTLVLGVGGLITAIIALFSARSGKNKINSETSLNNANVEQSRENLHQSRELFLRTEVEKIRETLQEEINLLRSEVTSLRILIESHVPWDWEVVRQLKLAGIDFRDPPTLNYLKQQPEET